LGRNESGRKFRFVWGGGKTRQIRKVRRADWVRLMAGKIHPSEVQDGAGGVLKQIKESL